jgi:hypothetical protein
VPADITLAPRGLAVPSAVSLYRSKFLDYLAGAVQYSYRNVDLLWDNAIAGLGMPRFRCSRSPGPSP